MVNDEFRINLVEVAARYCQGEMLRVNEKHHPQHEKQRELRKNNHAACEQRRFAVAFVARCEKPLHHGLVRAVTCHG